MIVSLLLLSLCLATPAFAWELPFDWDPTPRGGTRLPGGIDRGSPGNVLIADTGNNRVIEVMPFLSNRDEYYADWYVDYEDLVNAEAVANISLNIGMVDALTRQPNSYSHDYEDTLPHTQCSYDIDWAVNGPVWAQWMNNDVFFPNPEGALMLVVVAGFEGCPDNRVRIYLIKALHDGNCRRYLNNDYNEPYVPLNCTQSLWSYGSQQPGSGLTELNHPVHATQLLFFRSVRPPNSDLYDEDGTNTFNCLEIDGVLPNFDAFVSSGDILITDQGNNRILLVTFCKQQMVWMYGPTSGPYTLNAPSMTQQLRSGNILIADTGNGRILEISVTGNYVASHTTYAARPRLISRIDVLSGLNCPDLLENQYWGYCSDLGCDPQWCYLRNRAFDSLMGEDLVVDAETQQLITIAPNGTVTMSHDGDYGEITTAYRVLSPGVYLITDREKSRVYIWRKWKNQILWEYKYLNKPSSATMNGEETGQSWSQYYARAFYAGFFD